MDVDIRKKRHNKRKCCSAGSDMIWNQNFCLCFDIPFFIFWFLQGRNKWKIRPEEKKFSKLCACPPDSNHFRKQILTEIGLDWEQRAELSREMKIHGCFKAFRAMFFPIRNFSKPHFQLWQGRTSETLLKNGPKGDEKLADIGPFLFSMRLQYTLNQKWKKICPKNAKKNRWTQGVL